MKYVGLRSSVKGSPWSRLVLVFSDVLRVRRG